MLNEESVCPSDTQVAPAAEQTKLCIDKMLLNQ